MQCLRYEDFVEIGNVVSPKVYFSKFNPLSVHFAPASQNTRADGVGDGDFEKGRG
jgi:hypothetical protein